METVSKQTKNPSSLMVTAKINLIESGEVVTLARSLLNGSGPTDDWVQEAVMPDTFHQTSQSDKKCQSRD